jgi:DNA topoisomerase I
MGKYSKTLVVVESPAKAKIITKYLNSISELTDRYGKFTVIASYGHIADLKKKELSVDVENNFKPSYEVNGDKKKVIAELSKKIKEHDMVLLASDADMEGEAIAWHIRNLFKLKVYRRITFNEITMKALKTAVLNCGDIDMNLFCAQQARRVLDRLVGFKLSPLLWKMYKTDGSGLSAGRVQSAVLNIIVSKEKEVKDFETSCYWSFDGCFSNDISEAKLYLDSTIHKVDDLNHAKALVGKMTETFKVDECVSKLKKVNPEQPFITSTLQQEAYNKLGYGVKRTMKLAQDLYENGHITYMRTDSYNMSEDAVSACRQYIVTTYGSAYYNENATAKKKGHSQEAHECIRPTKMELPTVQLSKEHNALYDMIWKRAVASRMTAAVYDELTVSLVNPWFKEKGMYFLGKFKQLKFEGFLKLFGETVGTQSLKAKQEELKNAVVKCKEVQARNTWKSPPARYNESSIIKVLDTEGIGRPSTYASIMAKLYEKSYVNKLDIAGETKKTVDFIYKPSNKTLKEQSGKVQVGQEKNKLVPTAIGDAINTFLSEHFAYIIDKNFTAEMESHLDKIAEGKLKYTEEMAAFWKDFKKHLAKFDTVKIQRGNKTSLKNESKVIKIDDITYTVRVSRYGPVVQYQDKDDKPVYLDLKNYLKLVGKDYRDVDASDVHFIRKIPFRYSNDIELKSGMYGYYLVYKGQNCRLPAKYIDKNTPENMFKLDKKTLEDICKNQIK